MRTLLKDVRFGVRTLLKRPGFTAVAVLTLALGVGANTAIFSVVNGVLFKPLPLKEAERLVLVYETTPTQPRSFVSVPNLEDYRAGTRSFESFATYVPQSVNLTGGGEPERVVGAFVPSGFFKTVGVEPALGRAFLPEDDVEGAGLVAVLGHETWQKRFGADPSAVGKSLVLNGEPYQIVGVMPEGFGYPISSPDVLLPAQ
ncbi:MAG: ABC transporter permease, partial [Gemmatimonadaceae bacterium]